MTLLEEAKAMLETGRAEEARRLLQPAADRRSADLATLTAYAVALKRLGRRGEALAAYRAALVAAPASGVAEHNLAGFFGDLGRHAEAEAGALRAFAKGLRTPETSLVLARALAGQARLDDSAAAYRRVLREQPGHVAAQREYAQLAWMRSGSATQAAAALDAAVAAYRDAPSVLAVKARLLGSAGDAAGERAALEDALVRHPDDPALSIAASRAAAGAGDAGAALAHARRVHQLAPGRSESLGCLAEASLAVGNPVEGQRLAETLLRTEPDNAYAIALLATAWRLLGDPGYRRLYDYDPFVLTGRLATPPGWPSFTAYLHELAREAAAAHPFAAEPLHQSLRAGTQRPDLLAVDSPAIRALPAALDPPIRAALGRLGRGSDPLRRRNGAGYAFAGLWSVRLRPGGHHVDHVHPGGWLSSACYLELPAAVGDGPDPHANGRAAGGRRAGWLRLGQPGITTRPALGAEHWVKPVPGLLALFPSYMWHGTEPFEGARHRLTIAFDLLPAG